MIPNSILFLKNANHPRWCWQRLRSFYDWRSRNDTIFAPATAIQPGKGSPLGIVRLSGPKVGHVVEKITKLNLLANTSNDTSSPSRVIKPRSAKLTKLFDPVHDELIDVGLVLWFPKPNSYTGEDVCEFQVHGSQAVINRLLTVLARVEGVRPAEPGEFTYRAHKNGKMSLLEVEGLSELISSKTDQQRRLALRGLTGTTRKKYDDWIECLVKILAHLEASIDFGEDELIGEEQVVDECTLRLRKLSEEIECFITIGNRCRDFTQAGARIAILGRPNAGKSTIMNLLCRRNKSIVSDLSGTTRDIVEHSFELGGHTVTLSDTAGLKDPRSLFLLEGQMKDKENTKVEGNSEESTKTVIEQHDVIEREGIRRALEAAKDADMILYLYDAGHFKDTNIIIEELTTVLSNFCSTSESRIKIKSLHLVINKIDLKRNLLDSMNATGGVETNYDWNCFRQTLESKLNQVCALDYVDVTLISCKSQTNIDVLIEKLASNLDGLFEARLRQNLNVTEKNDIEFEYMNERHSSLLQSVSRHLNRASQLDIRSIDEMAQHVRESVDYLSRIVGSITNEQVLDIIFRDFCIGK